MHVSSVAEHPINLRKLFPEAEFVGADDVDFGFCSCDSRTVQPGELFVALRGTIHDGHDYAAQAAARGCAAIVAERPIGSVTCPVCYVADTHQALAQVCQALAGDPSRQLKVIGVTGTNGKTTTTYLIASVLHAGGHKAGVLGTLGCFDGADIVETDMTTPPPQELASHLARMARNGCSHAVMEVSSHALDQSRVGGIGFDVGCVTNVRRDHLDYHHTMHDYRLAKSRLFHFLVPEGIAVINADDPTAAGYLTQIDGPVLTVGIHSAAEITAEVYERLPSEQTFLLTAGSDTIPVRTRMIGTYHVYNCLMAAAVGLAYEIDLVKVVRGLEAVEALPGRLERIECGQPFSVFVDFAHTPDALTQTLETLREVTGGRVICVFGAGGDRDREKRPLMGRSVEAAADLAVITNDNPRSEEPEAIHYDLLAGFQHPGDVEIIPDRAEAIDWALSEARPGDSVLIAGKGHETYQIIGHQRLDFDDREVARQVLYHLEPHRGLALRTQ